MLRSNIQMSEFVEQLKTLLLSAIVKRDRLAMAFDTSLEMRKAADRYINAIDNGDDWNSYVVFDRDVLLAAGLDKNLISFYQQDKENIPREVRPKVVSIQRQYIIDNYVETNDYYLMLHGEPPIEDNGKGILCPPNDYGIPTTIPVHKLSIEYINLMESAGIINTLIEKYPNRPYLKYLGKKAIPYYDARIANNFSLLYVELNGVDPVIREDFISFYDKARAYYMVGVYNKEFANMFLWYDEFIGFLIITMAVQRLISNIFKQGLTRDFYDVNLIKYLFRSYSIPYIEDLDIKYQRAIAKNLNYLLRYKSTDKVLYDVAYLLGFYDINLYKYYLVKSHILDEDGNPVFPKKTVKVNGETIEIPDYENMYQFHFQQVNLKETDITATLLDKKLSHTYSDIVTQDPYWTEDSELKQKMYETQFNQIITKYMSVDVMIKIVEMMFELCHTIRMVIDNKKDFQKIMVSIPAVTQFDTNLFDIIIFACALSAYKTGLPGSVPLKGHQIANVYGFNYTRDLEPLRQAIYDTKDLTVGDILYAEDTKTFYQTQPGPKVKILNHFRNEATGTNTDEYTTVTKNTFRALDVAVMKPSVPLVEGKYYYDPSNCEYIYHINNSNIDAIPVTVVSTLAYNLIDNNLAQYIKGMRAVKESDMGVIYKDIKTLRQFIVKMLADTDDIDVYQQYEKLYHALLVTEDVQDLYRDSDGTPYRTFATLLEAINPTLYTIYLQCTENPLLLNRCIDSILAKMGLLGDYTYLPNINRIDSLFNTVLQLMRFFKSYTVDFISSGIQYVFDDRYLQALKLIDEVIITGSVKDIEDTMHYTNQAFKDLIDELRSIILQKDAGIKTEDEAFMDAHIFWHEYYNMHLADTVYKSAEKDVKTDLRMTGIIDNIEVQNFYLHDPNPILDDVYITAIIQDIICKSLLPIHDGVYRRSRIIIPDTPALISNDTVTHTDTNLLCKDRLSLQDRVRIKAVNLS